jgi:hypothetical protein
MFINQALGNVKWERFGFFWENCRLGRFHSNYNAKGLPPIYYDEERNVAARDVDPQGPDALQGVDHWVAHGIEGSGGGMR